MITFPPQVLGPDPVRLPVLGRGEGWFAIDKPAGLSLAPDSWDAEAVPSIVPAIHAAAMAGKPQLAALGITGCSRTHTLDAELAGVAVLASREDAAGRLRDSLGSGRWEFVFDLVVEASGGTAPIVCELPIVAHESRPRMIVSHRHGKRCRTEFTLVRQFRGHALWRARTAENRVHQIRLHAAESGLRIVGEFLYARVASIHLSSLKRGYRPGREAERPLHPGLAMHLHTVRGIEPGSSSSPWTVESPRPKTLATLLRRLEEAS